MLIFLTVCCGITLVDYKLGIEHGLLLFLGLALLIYRLISEQRGSFEIAPKIEELIEISELTVSIASSLKSQIDLAIGNILGPNIFNILAALSIPCIFAPTDVGPQVFWLDYLAILLLTAALMIFAIGRNQDRNISQPKGIILLTI